MFSGVLTADAEGRVRAPVPLPDFNGTVRLMAVAWTAEGVGQAEADVLVRDPVVVQVAHAAVPRAGGRVAAAARPDACLRAGGRGGGVGVGGRSGAVAGRGRGVLGRYRGERAAGVRRGFDRRDGGRSPAVGRDRDAGGRAAGQGADPAGAAARPAAGAADPDRARGRRDADARRGGVRRAGAGDGERVAGVRAAGGVRRAGAADGAGGVSLGLHRADRVAGDAAAVLLGDGARRWGLAQGTAVDERIAEAIRGVLANQTGGGRLRAVVGGLRRQLARRLRDRLPQPGAGGGACRAGPGVRGGAGQPRATW